MKYLIYSLLAFSILLPLEASALTKAKAACVCNSAVADPFEEPMIFATGSKAGKCIDSCYYRKVRVLSKREKIAVANVRHKGQHVIAEFDPRGAYEIDILFQHFFPTISHVAFRIRFARDYPVILHSQINSKARATQTTHDLVISVEAALPKGENFDFAPAKNGDYPLVYRLITIEEAVRWMIHDKKDTVNQFQLNVPKDALPDLLRLALKRSEARSFTVPYRLFSSNCSSSIFDMLDTVTRATPPEGGAWYRRAWPVWGPLGTLQYLKNHKLIKKQLPDLGPKARRGR